MSREFVVFVSHSCLTLCNPADCNPPGSSVHGISQARTLKWVAISSSRRSSRPRDRNPVLGIGRMDSLPLSHLGSLNREFRGRQNGLFYI